MFVSTLSLVSCGETVLFALNINQGGVRGLCGSLCDSVSVNMAAGRTYYRGPAAERGA